MDRLAHDIAIPITKPRLTHNVRKLSSLDPSSFEAIYEQTELAEIYRVQLKMEFATLETEVHQDDLVFGRPALAQEILSSLTKMVMQRAKLVNVFAELVPLVRSYVTNRCFGKSVDVDAEAVRAHLVRLDLREGISNYLARKISELTVEKRVLEFENANFKLSDTKPFSWRRNLPPLTCERTVFNHVATVLRGNSPSFLTVRMTCFASPVSVRPSRVNREPIFGWTTSNRAARLAFTTPTGSRFRARATVK